MKPVMIYTAKLCPYCFAAKRLLKQKGIGYEEIDVTLDQCARQTMTERAAGRHTVPQIFVGDHHVGGCDDLFALDDKGELDSLVAA